MCCKRYYIIFSTFSLKFKCKICVQKEVIHNFKNHIWVTCPTYRFSKEKSYNFHFHKNDVTWPLSANGLLVLSRTVLTLSVQNGPACSKLVLEKLGPIWPLGSIWLFSFYSASFEFFIDFNFVGSGVHAQATAHSPADQSFTLLAALYPGVRGQKRSKSLYHSLLNSTWK